MEVVLDGLKRAFPASPAFLHNKTKPMWEKNLNNKTLLLPKEKTLFFLLHSQPAAAAFSRIPPNTSYSQNLMHYLSAGCNWEPCQNIYQESGNICQASYSINCESGESGRILTCICLKHTLVSCPLTGEGCMCLKQKPSAPEKNKKQPEIGKHLRVFYSKLSWFLLFYLVCLSLPIAGLENIFIINWECFWTL